MLRFSNRFLIRLWISLCLPLFLSGLPIQRDQPQNEEEKLQNKLEYPQKPIQSNQTGEKKFIQVNNHPSDDSFSWFYTVFGSIVATVVGSFIVICITKVCKKYTTRGFLIYIRKRCCNITNEVPERKPLKSPTFKEASKENTDNSDAVEESNDGISRSSSRDEIESPNKLLPTTTSPNKNESPNKKDIKWSPRDMFLTKETHGFVKAIYDYIKYRLHLRPEPRESEWIDSDGLTTKTLKILNEHDIQIKKALKSYCTHEFDPATFSDLYSPSELRKLHLPSPYFNDIVEETKFFISSVLKDYPGTPTEELERILRRFDSYEDILPSDLKQSTMEVSNILYIIMEYHTRIKEKLFSLEESRTYDPVTQNRIVKKLKFLSDLNGTLLRKAVSEVFNEIQTVTTLPPSMLSSIDDYIKIYYLAELSLWCSEFESYSTSKHQSTPPSLESDFTIY